MSTFSRTISGISNSRHFHGVDFTAYIEGKGVDGTVAAAKSYDEVFYECLLSAASGGRKVKVKCVGNKAAALDYAKLIREGGISKSVVIVDKDLEGVLSSPISVFPVISTYGYSWENELWSQAVIASILVDLTNMPDRVISEIESCFPRIVRQLKYLSLLDIACQTNGASLLNKRSSLCGVAFAYPTITLREIRRLRAVFRTSAANICPVARRVIKDCSRFDFREVIQGHFWANFMTRMIVAIYRKLVKDVAPSNAALTNLALSNMRKDPAGALSEELIARYRLELVRVGV